MDYAFLKSFLYLLFENLQTLMFGTYFPEVRGVDDKAVTTIKEEIENWNEIVNTS